MKVHNELGSGFLESVYHEALEILFKEEKNLLYRNQNGFRIFPNISKQKKCNSNI